MLNIIALLAATAVSQSTRADSSSLLSAPSYSSASIVNSANFQPGALAPNMLATIFGADLSWVTAAVTPSDIGTRLPTALPGTGVRVLTCGLSSGLYYVSPTQVNFLVPAMLVSGNCAVQVVTDGRAGPEAMVEIRAAAPALFTFEGGWVIATRPDGSVIGRDKPARPGEVVVIYGAGFGQTDPAIVDGTIPRVAAYITQFGDAKVLLDGKPVDRLFYVGVTPGFVGLYQLNLTLPAVVGDDPEVVLRVGDQSSPAGARLALRNPESNPPQPVDNPVRY